MYSVMLCGWKIVITDDVIDVTDDVIDDVIDDDTDMYIQCYKQRKKWKMCNMCMEKYISTDQLHVSTSLAIGRQSCGPCVVIASGADHMWS